MKKGLGAPKKVHRSIANLVKSFIWEAIQELRKFP
jgi:hypothetical protein